MPTPTPPAFPIPRWLRPGPARARGRGSGPSSPRRDAGHGPCARPGLGCCGCAARQRPRAGEPTATPGAQRLACMQRCSTALLLSKASVQPVFFHLYPVASCCTDCIPPYAQFLVSSRSSFGLLVWCGATQVIASPVFACLPALFACLPARALACICICHSSAMTACLHCTLSLRWPQGTVSSQLLSP